MSANGSDGNVTAACTPQALGSYVRANQQFYDLLFENNPDAVFVLDLEGVVVAVNPACETISGYAREVILNKRFQLITSVEQTALSNFYEKLFAEGKPFTTETTIPHKAGHLIDLQVTCAPLVIDGQLVGVSGIAKDITERNQEREKLRHSEERYRLISEHSLDMIATNLATTEYTFVSPSSRNLLGYEPEELIGLRALDFFHPDDLAHYLRTYAGTGGRGEEMFVTTYRVRHKQGHYVWIESTSRVVRAAGTGEIANIITISRDVSDRRRAEMALVESEAKFRLMAENMTDLVSVTNREGIVEYASPSHEKVVGLSPAMIEGKNAFAFIHPTEHAAAMAAFTELITSKQPQNLDVRCRSLTSGWVTLDGRGVPVVGESGEVEKIVIVARDISERKKTEELLLQSEKLSIAGQLAAGVAHEIRNPLTSLKGFLQLMQGSEIGKKHYFDVMISELNRIELIVSELLVLAKPQATRFKAKALPLIVQDVVTLLEGQAIMSNVQLVTDFAEKMPLVECDENQLKQVFINFLKNAIEAQTGGEIRIEVQRHEADQVRVRFVDQGCGIPEERILKLGEPFYTTKDQGTGLGLMVSYKIIEQHQGRICIDSVIGRGTTIDVLLPIATGAK